MDLLNDPDMREIVLSFCEEANQLFDELEEILDELEDNPKNTAQLEKFGQVIDRVMGAAASIGATEIATFCELGKTIGYKSSQIDDLPLLNVVIAILFDSIDLLRKMIQKIKTNNAGQLTELNTEAFVKRLRWLSDKFKNIDRASCSFEKKGTGTDASDNMGQGSIDDLMASLGL